MRSRVAAAAAALALALQLQPAVNAAAAAATPTNTSAGFVSLASYPLARCLDGSHAGYYVRRATRPSAADSWLFLLDGGGLCTTEADCTSRSKTDLGSSLSWPQSYALNATDLTTPDSRNPFAAWNMVYLQYCDGSMHSGARTAPSAETWNLWFAGHHTIAATLSDLSRRAGLNATAASSSTGEKVTVVFSGGSAGGVGVFSNYEFVAESLPHALVLGAPVGVRNTGSQRRPSASCLCIRSAHALAPCSAVDGRVTCPRSSGSRGRSPPPHRTTCALPPSHASRSSTPRIYHVAAWQRSVWTRPTSASSRTTPTRT
jgi:hypothetical protein